MRDELTPTERAAERMIANDPLRKLSRRQLEARLQDAEWMRRIYQGSTQAHLCTTLGEHVDEIRRELRRRDGH